MTTIALADPPELPAGSRDVFLPIVGGPPPEPEPEPETPATAFVALLTSDNRQQRRSLEVCACLEQAAMWRAFGLSHGDPWSHVDRHGIRPNAYARRAGCVLPPDYAMDGNNVESLCAGSPDANVMFAALAASASHRIHLFGELDFYRQQDKIGVAVCEGPGEFRWYWCVMISRCE